MVFLRILTEKSKEKEEKREDNAGNYSMRVSKRSKMLQLLMQCCSLLLFGNHFLALSFLLILLVFSLCFFSFGITSAEFCGDLKEGMSSQIHMISCVFSPHDWLSLFINKYYTFYLFLNLQNYPFSHILDSFRSSILKVLTMWQAEDYKLSLIQLIHI